MAVSRFNPDYPDAGLVQVVPTSVAVGSGSATVDGNGAVTFSGASSVSLNNCFISGYDNYRVMIIGTASSTSSGYMNVRFRANGSDNTSNSYFRWGYTRTNGTTTNFYGQNTYAILGVHGNAGWHVSADFLQTKITGQPMFTATSHNLSNLDNEAVWSQGCFNGADSFDGFTIIAASGTITGTIRVYGYRN